MYVWKRIVQRPGIISKAYVGKAYDCVSAQFFFYSNCHVFPLCAKGWKLLRNVWKWREFRINCFNFTGVFFFFSIMLYNLLQKYTFLILIISLHYYVINNSDLEKRRKSDNYVETFERKLYDFPPTFFPQFPFITLSRVLTNSDTNYVCINYSSSARTKLSIHPRLFPFSFIFQAK